MPSNWLNLIIKCKTVHESGSFYIVSNNNIDLYKLKSMGPYLAQPVT